MMKKREQHGSWMKNGAMLLLTLLFCFIFNCPVSADSQKIGTVSVKDVLWCVDTNEKHVATGYYNRSDSFEEYIYPGTTITIYDSDAIAKDAQITDRSSQKKTYSGNGEVVAFEFTYPMDKATYDALKDTDINKSNGGGGTGYPSGTAYFSYSVKILDSNGKALPGYKVSKNVTGFDNARKMTTETTNANGEANLSDFNNGWMDFDARRGYVPTSADLDQYNNRVGLMGGLTTDTQNPIIIKDTKGNEIATIVPKAFTDALYRGYSRDIVVDNQYFTIKTNSLYSVSITSHPYGVNYDYDYPQLYITVRQRKSISGLSAALTNQIYNYDGKEKKPGVSISGLKYGTDFKITSYKNNKNIGTAAVTIAGIGNYTGTKTLRFTIRIRKGLKYTYRGVKYEVTSVKKDSTGELKAIAPVSRSSKTIAMPSTMTLGGKKYKVTSIGTRAFKDCKKLTRVTIGGNVATISRGAFQGCTALTSITIPAKVKNIYKDAFRSCGRLKAITVKSTVLKKVDSNVLRSIYRKAVIKVPKKYYKTYSRLLKKKGQAKTVKIKKM